MPQYRLYHLDGTGRVSSAEWLEAPSDEAAVEAAGADNSSVQCELWQGRRLVTRFAGGGAIPPNSSPTSPGSPIPPKAGAGWSGAPHRS